MRVVDLADRITKYVQHHKRREHFMEGAKRIEARKKDGRWLLKKLGFNRIAGVKFVTLTPALNKDVLRGFENLLKAHKKKQTRKVMRISYVLAGVYKIGGKRVLHTANSWMVKGREMIDLTFLHRKGRWRQGMSALRSSKNEVGSGEIERNRFREQCVHASITPQLC